MAVKIVRQPNKIALIGAPTSAAAMSAGHEAAPSALRHAGLIDRLSSIGYQVTDLGDDPTEIYKPDDESPRARNVSGVIRAIEALKPRVEQAVKSLALPLILSGDCSVALATVAGVRRYFRNVSMIYMDRDADMNTPATTPSGCIDGMVVSHLAGRGAAELVRFWPEPPLVRDPDLALFGVDRLDPSEEEALRRFPLSHYLAHDIKRMGAATAAKHAIDRIHGSGREFVLHFDVDVIADFQATNYPGSDGLTLDDVKEALDVFAQQKHLAAIEVTAYNPAKDADGAAAKLIIDLLAGALEKRLAALTAGTSPAAPALAEAGSATPAPAAASPESVPPVESPALAPEPEVALPAVQSGAAWSSDAREESPLATAEEPPANQSDELPLSDGQSSGEQETRPDKSNEPHEDSLDPAAGSGEPHA